jgi:hypothetical protein
MLRQRRNAHRSTWRAHSLSLTLAAVIAFLLLVYVRSDPHTHLGAFYGNAIADWLGVFVFVIATKYFFETRSSESRQPSTGLHSRLARVVIDHSLTIVLAATGAAWIAVYAHSAVDSKAGEVVGNIVSDWTQVLGLVLLTKYTREQGSKESR